MSTVELTKVQSSVPQGLIEESKERCYRNGLQVDASVLDVPEIRHYSGKLPHSFCKRGTIFADITEIMNNSVIDYGGVIFYAKNNGFIYAESGEPRFMELLKRRNLSVGGSLKEEYIGTTAASFVQPGMEQFIVGDDHYLDIFKEYTTYCAQYTSYVSNYYIFVIMPNAKLTKFFSTHMKLFNIAKIKAIMQHKAAVELRLKDELLNSQYKKQAVLYLDEYGVIVNGNQQFYNWFNMEPDDVLDTKYFVTLPELEEMHEDIMGQKDFVNTDCIFHSTPPNMRYMSVAALPIFQNNKRLGTLLTISNEKKSKTVIKSTKPQYTFNNIIGNSKIMRQSKFKALNAAQSDSSVILTGESGTGKEYFAQAIHNESHRKDGPFVSINCSAMPEDLISSELFGYVDGAFTGGRKGGAVGKFEYADKGTIFLDEIGDMPLNVQAVLLRVLEERTVYRLGSNTAVPVDVRIICATNKNLKSMVQNGEFRLDLYYRINVVNILLPSLRDRMDDMSELLDYHLKIFNKQTGKNIKGLTTAAKNKIMEYNWPGNLRELRNMVEYGVNNSFDYIDIGDLPNDILEFAGSTNGDTVSERDELMRLYLQTGKNKSLMAKSLGIARGTLYKKLSMYGIE